MKGKAFSASEHGQPGSPELKQDFREICGFSMLNSNCRLSMLLFHTVTLCCWKITGVAAFLTSHFAGAWSSISVQTQNCPSPTKAEKHISHLKPNEIQRIRAQIYRLPYMSPPMMQLPCPTPFTKLLPQLAIKAQLEKGWRCLSSST